jgi:ABC-type lipoprotein release transport system permease subunit
MLKKEVIHYPSLLPEGRALMRSSITERKAGMRLYLRLAWRNVWRHRRRTLIVVLAIALTMAMMMMYDGMMAGFTDSIYANAIKVLGGNIQIHAQGYQAKMDQKPLLPLKDPGGVVKLALAQPQVVAASQRIQTGGLATNQEGAFPVSIVGIEPEKELPVSLVAQNVAAGRYLKADDQDAVFIGKGLADAMDVKVGDSLTLVGRAPHDQMRRRTMTVAGIYDVGMKDVERRTVYMSLTEAQNLYDLRDQATEVAISLQSLGQEAAVMKALQPALQEQEIASWQTNFPELQQAVGSKNGVMNIFSVIILAIAGIGILNLLLMAVYERTREIGIMGAIGFKPRQVSTLFLLEGALMGVLGAAAGVALGVLVNGLLAKYGVDYSAYANLTQYTALLNGRIYSTLGLENLPMRILTAIIVSILAAYYPAREAAHKEPAEALHFV